MKFESMTWKEIEEKQKKVKIVIVPISPLEEHGPHLPVSVDYFRAYEVSEKAAEKANVFCLPPLILGCVSKGYAFPGTVSITKKTLRNIVIDICTSLKDTGFRNIIFVSGHGGSNHTSAIRDAIKKMHGKNILFYVVHDLEDKGLREKLIETAGDSHAGEKETSDMLYLAPDQVDMKKSVKSFPKYPARNSPKVLFKKANPSGVFGDATKANRKKGEIMINNAIKNLVKVINKLK